MDGHVVPAIDSRHLQSSPVTGHRFKASDPKVPGLAAIPDYPASSVSCGNFRDNGRVHLQNPSCPFKRVASGEMAEWLKAHAWKACVRETVPWVRIPLSPPPFALAGFGWQATLLDGAKGVSRSSSRSAGRLMTTKPKCPANTIESAAGSHRFDVAVLRDVAGEKVFARGAAYHEDGQVEIVTFDRTRVLARVIGSEVYRCELVGMGKKFSGECSCPAFSDWGFCKHLVATALAANSLGAGALKQASSRFAKIREHLRGRGVEGLVEMVVGLAERDPSLLKELELSAAAAGADDTTLLAQFKKAITEATRTHDYVEYPQDAWLGAWDQERARSDCGSDRQWQGCIGVADA